MIGSFKCSDTEALFNGERVLNFRQFESPARRKLQMLHAATELRDLRSPGSQLEKLKGNRAGQWSIRINARWRLCFVWKDGGAHDVEITDYH